MELRRKAAETFAEASKTGELKEALEELNGPVVEDADLRNSTAYADPTPDKWAAYHTHTWA